LIPVSVMARTILQRIGGATEPAGRATGAVVEEQGPEPRSWVPARACIDHASLKVGSAPGPQRLGPTAAALRLDRLREHDVAPGSVALGVGLIAAGSAAPHGGGLGVAATKVLVKVGGRHPDQALLLELGALGRELGLEAAHHSGQVGLAIAVGGV